MRWRLLAVLPLLLVTYVALELMHWWAGLVWRAAAWAGLED